MRRWVMVLLLVGLSVLGLTSTADGQGDDADSSGAGYADLPDASVYGIGWHTPYLEGIRPVPGTDLSSDIHYYTDMSGNRLNIEIIDYGHTITDANVALQWMKVQIDGRQEQIAGDPSALSERRLNALDGIEGCAETYRAEGQELPTAYPVGATICVDEDRGLLIMVTVSGVIRPNGVPLQYHDASDYVVNRILDFVPSGATPVASPRP